MTETSPDQLAAHRLLCELRTRITIQSLPYQHGDEGTALDSLHAMFELSREAMKAYPGCRDFARVTTRMLNVHLRPLAAKWHRARVAGLLDSRDGADEFRSDLLDVQGKLRDFALTLQEMAYGTREPDEDTPPAIEKTAIDSLFAPLAFGIGVADDTTGVLAAINESEARAIDQRRGGGPRENAIGLALSGGGIRSATFCAGVLQFLASKKLLSKFDYLSTVSGGGYTGCLLSSKVGRDGNFDHLARPFGPDTAAFRYVRQHAKYLSATNLRGRWSLVVGTLAGMLLNWTAPLFLIITTACLFSILSDFVLLVLEWAAAVLAIATLAALIVYGFASQKGTPPAWALDLLRLTAGLAALVALLLLIEIGYSTWRPWVPSISVVSVSSLAVATPILVRFLAVFSSPKTREGFAKVLLWGAGLAVPALAVAGFYLFRRMAEWPMLSSLSLQTIPIAWWCLMGVDAVLGVFAFLALNVNATSPHRIYRDALAKTFLGPEDVNRTLSDLNPQAKAPYHLINATVNLPSSESPVLRDRRGDFFMFSKHWCGSMATGYHRTEDWEIDGGPVGLATAMAVSGAAASPHMGLGSKPTLTALMTLLNIRLGLWVPNPKSQAAKTDAGPLDNGSATSEAAAKPDEQSEQSKPFERPGFSCLMREMIGQRMSEKDSWLNLSDGGHVENLGLYELLRRRCKFIVSVDGEADPELTFHGNLTLVRHAQIDFGIRIEPRLDDLRLNDKGFSRTHAQLFKITYPKGASGREEGTGLLLYLKLSLTGNEGELLRRYRTLHPEFPHQSTADQFYDEEQFEAYRRLGVHVAQGVFSPALLTTNQAPATIEEWFRQLAENMLETSEVAS